MLMRLTNHEMVAHDPILLLLRSAIALELVPRAGIEPAWLLAGGF